MLVGDGVEAFDQDVYLGDSVEPVGGVFVIIEITDADKEAPAIVDYTKQWLVLNPVWVAGNDDEHNPFSVFGLEDIIGSIIGYPVAGLLAPLLRDFPLT